MEIEVVVQRADFPYEACWFVQVELQLKAFPSLQVIKRKQRTDLSISAAPKFMRNSFLFKDVSLAQRMVLSFGAIEVPRTSSDRYEHLKSSNVTGGDVKGIYHLVLTQRILSSLRDGVPFSEQIKLEHPVTTQDAGLLVVSIAFRLSGMEEQFIEDERALLKYEFDRDVERLGTVLEKIQGLQEVSEMFNTKLEKQAEQTDYIKNTLRSIGADLAMLKQRKEELEADNIKLHRKLEKLQSVEEIPVLIDMLRTSDSGLDELRRILAVHELKLKVELKRQEMMEKEWTAVEAKQRTAEAIRERSIQVRAAREEAEFHIARQKEQLPGVMAKREQVRSMDRLLTDMEEQLRLAPLSESHSTIELDVGRLKFEKQILEERFKQIQIELDLNDGLLSRQTLMQLEQEVAEDPVELRRLQKQGEEILLEIQRLGEKLYQEAQYTKDEAEEAEEGEIMSLEVQLMAAEVRVKTMQEDMDAQAVRFAKEISELAARAAMLE
mmetsp:Transcript_19015/g.34573  ORF Transcript_19015/g.34573 Transcript_19015/m.34573 type:complete len:494 (+) Transcript_19015:27-1508(+)